MTAHFPRLFLESRMGVLVEYRLNVWRYEMIMAIVIFVAALVCYRVLKNHAGDTALVVFSLYGASQILWESMRDDGHMLIIFLRVGQLAAFLLPGRYHPRTRWRSWYGPHGLWLFCAWLPWRCWSSHWMDVSPLAIPRWRATGA